MADDHRREGFVELAPIPFPEGRAGSAPYNAIRAAIALQASSAGPVDSVGETIDDIVQFIGELVDAVGGIGSLVDAIAGLFS